MPEAVTIFLFKVTFGAIVGALAGCFVGVYLGMLAGYLYERYEQWKGVDLSKFDVPLGHGLVLVGPLVGAIVGLIIGVILVFMA